MHRFQRLVVVAALLVLGACGVSEQDLRLTTDGNVYPPGGQVELTLHNGSLASVGYNLCFSQLQLHEGDTWVDVPWMREGTACPAILRELGGRSSATETLQLRADLPSGEYRFVARVEALGRTPAEVFLVESEPFRIGGATN